MGKNKNKSYSIFQFKKLNTPHNYNIINLLCHLHITKTSIQMKNYYYYYAIIANNNTSFNICETL